MATSEERLEQLEQALQQAGNALQAANCRIATLETAAGAPATPVTTTSSASMVDMHVLGNPSNFAGDEASWKSSRIVRLSFSAAVSPELRALMVEGQNDCRGHEERERHSARAGVEPTAVLHAQSEHEWRGAEEVAERARG